MSKKTVRAIRTGIAYLLVLAMMSGAVLTDGLALTAKAAGISVQESAGYEEGAYVEWALVDGADGYIVYTSQNQSSWTAIDDELIRSYGSYMRADALGLTAGTWYLKIEAATFDSTQNKIATVAEEIVTVNVTAHDRSGYAWVNGTSSGAYNEDGSLKADANVIYVTETTKDTVSLNVTGATANPCVGIQNILDGYKKGGETKPLNVRIIGNVTSASYMLSDDIVIENKNNSAAGITIEGVGEDAVANGWGIRVKNASNVEIRNLAFMNRTLEGEKDNVGLQQGNDHVWVHNCDMFYGIEGTGDQKKGDGALDCKLSDYVTFSYNHFWDSGKCCLLGLSEGTNDLHITYHHNWFDHSDSRHPRVRYYNTHVYNNYYDGNAKYGVGGAKGGASIFVENNYFRNCKYPMLISMQGSDLWDEEAQTHKSANAAFSSEDGSIIKAYGNYMEGQTRFIAYSETDDPNTVWDESVDFDAYVASSREEQVPSTVTAAQGGWTYNNFDTADDFYEYTPDAAEDVPEIVMAHAGRVNGGDFEWEFDDATEDSSSDINVGLQSACLNYTSSLVSVGGILGASVKVYYTVTFDPGNGDSTWTVETEANQLLEEPETPTNIPEGKVSFGGWYNGDTKWNFSGNKVTGNMTLTGKWLAEGEEPEEDEGGTGGTPIGTDSIVYDITASGKSSAYFTVDGNINGNAGTSAAYNGTTYSGNPLKLESSTTITFTTTTAAKLVLVLASDNTTTKVNVDGTAIAAVDGIVEVTIEAGTHTITKNATANLYAIYVIPDGSGTTDPTDPATEYTITVDKADGSATTTLTVNAGEAITSADLPTPTRAGYTFTGWVDGDNNAIALPYTPAGDMTIKATWQVESSGGDETQSYTITVDKADGSATTTLTVNAGEAITSADLPTPTREGYAFTGWVDGDNNAIVLPYTPAGDMTIKATWQVESSGEVDPGTLYNMELIASDIPAGTYTETFAKNGFTITAGESDTETVAVDANSKTIDGTAYTARLKTGGAGTADYRSIKFTTKAAATLYIACISSSSSVTRNMGVATLAADGNFVDYTGAYTIDGAAATATDGNIPVSGSNPGRYITIELTEADTYYIYSKEGGINFYAISVTYANGVDPVTCTVSFNAMGGLSVDAQQVQSGETCATPVETLRTGYTFAGWYTDYDCTKEYDFSTPVTGDMTLYAKWTEGEPAGEYLVLDMKDLPARDYKESFSKNGFSFTGTSSKALTVDSSAATVEGVTYTRRLKLNGSGSTSDRNISFTVEEDSVLTLVAATASTGFARALTVTNGTDSYSIENIDAAAKFTQALGAGTWYVYSPDSGVNIYFISVKAAGDVGAESYVITVDKADGSATTTLTVNAGVPVTETDLPTPTRAGYTFTGWVDGDNNPVSVPFTPTRDMTLTATWQQQGTGDPDPQPPVSSEGLVVELAEPGATYTYTGSAIKPAIIVTNNGEELTEGVDYTVKYSGNTKVSTEKTKAKITVTGKGNLTGSASTTFDILPKDISDDDVAAGDIVIATGTKPAPVLVYNNVKLTTKDYTLNSVGADGSLTAVGKYTADGQLAVTGKGNYTGTRTLEVKVVAKSDLKKFAVTVSKDTLIYNGGEQHPSQVTVTDSKTKETLTENTDYVIIWPENTTNAGTVKFTVIGMGIYTGSVTKSYTIKPLAAAAGTMTASGVNQDGYEYTSAGATVSEDLVVTYSSGAGDVTLTEGTDYKITYSNNKKVSTDKSQAKYTVTFLGNYKGTKALSGTFKVTAATLSGAEVVSADKVYTGKANTYVSKPYVTIDGVALKTSDYTVKYYKDAAMTEEITSKNKLSLADDASEATVYVKVTGKGNYAAEGSEATGSYRVRRTSKEAGNEIYDLSKAKVTVVDANGKKLSKVEYTGEALEPAVKVEYKIGKTYVTLTEGTDYEVTYVNNVNKGKATVVITGSGEKYVGSKTASFSVAARNLKGVTGLLDNLFSALGL